jgi:hypothetical protein
MISDVRRHPGLYKRGGMEAARKWILLRHSSMPQWKYRPPTFQMSGTTVIRLKISRGDLLFATRLSLLVGSGPARLLEALQPNLHRPRLIANYRGAMVNSEHGLGRLEEVAIGTKARLRISAFRDSAVARA